MTLYHICPHDAYRTMVLQEANVPFLSTDAQILPHIRQELTDNIYQDATIYHPAFTELLTFAVANMSSIDTMSRQRYLNDTRSDVNPFSAILIDLNRLFNLRQPESFLPDAQARAAQDLQDDDDTLRQRHLLRILVWIKERRRELPHTEILLAPVLEKHANLLNRQAPGLSPLQLTGMKDADYTATVELLTQLEHYQQQLVKTVLITGGQKYVVHRRLGSRLRQGYPLAICREILEGYSPTYTWDELWDLWETDLERMKYSTAMQGFYPRMVFTGTPRQRCRAAGQELARRLEFSFACLSTLVAYWPREVTPLLRILQRLKHTNKAKLAIINPLIADIRQAHWHGEMHRFTALKTRAAETLRTLRGP